MDSIHIKLVVPSLLKDLPILLKNVEVYFKYLPIDKICIIGDDRVRDALPSSDSRFAFVDEATLLDTKSLTIFYNDKCENIKNNRIGWYIQQFAKMSYALNCADEYYLVWDSDTIPVKPISLFNKHGQPFFDYKTEYHKQYFDCISRLFPNYSKQINGSFIAEHMLIKTSIMKELINAIEANNSLEGNNFQEKIISAVNPKYLMGSGFSEFETYSTYTLKKYPSLYILRKWKS